MLVSSTAECPPFIANDGCLIREVLHPAKTGVPLPYSLAVAEVAPGACTRRHRLAQDEVYYLLEGGILQGFHLLFGTDVSLKQVFTPRGLEVESAEGLLNVVAVLLSFVAGCV